jgi:hypothetical protein
LFQGQYYQILQSTGHNHQILKHYLATLIDSINSQQSVRIDVTGGEAVKTRTIGNQGIKIPQLAFVGSTGQHLAYTDDVTVPLNGYTAI